MCKKSIPLFLTLILSLPVVLVAVEKNDSSPTLNILRCCGHHEDLDSSTTCSPSGKLFKPLIYSPEDGNYLEVVPPSWNILARVRPRCTEDRALRYIRYSKSNPYVLFDNGVVITDLNSDSKLEPREYCLGSSGLLGCVPLNEGRPEAATIKPRLRKCCGDNAAYEKNSCVDADNPSLLDSLLLPGMELVSGFPICRQLDKFSIVGDMSGAIVQPDASLLVKGQRIPAEEFCVEIVRIEGKEVVPAKVFACSEHAWAKESDKAKSRDIRFILYPIGLLISSVFLLATMAAGWLLPASHHQLHWRCQTHHVACLMLGDLSMAVIQLAGDSLLQGRPEYCQGIAILAHFFFLATFFWLNTMCFNIWWTFRDLRPSSLEKSQELIRLRLYAGYAWGGPLIISGLAAVLDHLPQRPGQTLLRPRFGETQCWFVGDMEIFAYFYGPIGVLLAINLLFFAATAFELTCGLWKGDFAKSTTERAALGKVCLKLVIVMGVPWIFDVISWWIGGPNFLWYVTDSLNALQGVFIFVVVVCQPHVRAALRRAFRNPVSRQGTTSHGIPSLGDSVTQNKTPPIETI